MSNVLPPKAKKNLSCGYSRRMMLKVYKLNNRQIRMLWVIDEFLLYMLKLQQKGNTFEHIVIIKMMGIRNVMSNI